MRKLVVISLLALAALAAASPAAANGGWTTGAAAAKVKATYTTVDPVRLEWAKGRGDQDLIDQAMHSAKPDKVTCIGVGKKARRYTKFHCTAHVIGTGEWATDGFSATKRLTLIVRPFRIVAGWR